MASSSFQKSDLKAGPASAPPITSPPENMKISLPNLIVATVFAVAASSATAQTLGSAGNYDIFVTNGGILELKDANQLFGQVAISNSAQLKAGKDDQTFDGTIFAHTGSSIDNESKLHPSGGIQRSVAINDALNLANADLNAYRTYLAGLSATGGGSNVSVTSTSSFNSTGSLNVLDFKTIDLDKESFTLTGGAGGMDTFVIRVNTEFEFKESDLVLNNLNIDNVIWYYTGTKNFELHKSDSDPANFMKFAGTVIAPNAGDVRIGEVDFTGRVYGSNLKMGSGFKFQGAVPEPSSSVMMIFGAASLLLVRRRKH
ncbi:MAG: PEP-CTERM sorting domain-containing protein [Luteolibacter sp.]